MDLMIDGIVERQLTEEECEVVVMNLIKDIGMTPIDPFRWWTTDDMGGSCYQALAESHFAMDYVGDGSAIWIHLSSCKPYDDMATAKYLIEKFLIKELLNGTPYIINRGTLSTEKTPRIKFLMVDQGCLC